MQPNKRDRLIDSASELFHSKGLSSTSLADIAKHSDVPIGNVYYYFKTKDELALAALEKRKAMLEQVCKGLDESLSDPRERLMEAARNFTLSKDKMAKFGSPIGKLVYDGDLSKGAVANAATNIFNTFLGWAEAQFQALGQGDASRAHAVTLLSGLEGVVLVAKSLHDATLIEQETNRLLGWLESLPNKKIFLGKAHAKTGNEAA